MTKMSSNKHPIHSFNFQNPEIVEFICLEMNERGIRAKEQKKTPFYSYRRISQNFIKFLCQIIYQILCALGSYVNIIIIFLNKLVLILFSF
jgi:hypothetical protein